MSYVTHGRRKARPGTITEPSLFSDCSALPTAYTRNRSLGHTRRLSFFAYYLFFFLNRQTHRIINKIDTKAKCRHLKNWPVKGLCARCLKSLWTGDTASHIGIFDPALWTVAPLTFSHGSTLSSPPFPFPCVNKYAVYTYTACKWRGLGFWVSDRWTPAAKSLYR